MIKKNSIVLVPFQFDDFTTVKVRPALCLSNEIVDSVIRLHKIVTIQKSLIKRKLGIINYQTKYFERYFWMMRLSQKSKY